MNVTGWHEELISKRHNREAFDCGEAALNEFLRRYACRSHEFGGAKTFVAVKDAEPEAVPGFYSLCPTSVETRDFGVTCLFVSCDGSLWIGTGNAKLLQVKNGMVRTYGADGGVILEFLRHAGWLALEVSRPRDAVTFPVRQIADEPE